MSQRIVLELLKELGGKAKTKEISNLAKIKFPESCLYEFVGHKLERLASWGYVHHDRINGVWYISALNNSIDQALSQPQNAFAQGNDIGTTFPQIHNFTSTPPAPVNSWIIESKNGVVIIDTQRTLPEANNALDKIKELDKPILGVIISHPHPDHIGGTEVLLNGTTNVPIYSTQLAYDIMKNDTGGLIALAKQLHGAEYTNQVTLPNRIVQSGENVTIDGITYNFEDIGPGEGGDMMLTYLPEQKLLFTGDVVNNQMHPVFIEGHSTEWIKQIEDIKQNYPDAKVLYPGHGRPGLPKTLLDEQLNYINTFRSLVERQVQLAAEEAEGGANVANITDEGKTQIKTELQRLSPNYLHVALMPLETMLDLNIDAVTKEIGQEI